MSAKRPRAVEEKDNKTFACSMCSLKYRTSAPLAQHFLQQHPDHVDKLAILLASKGKRGKVCEKILQCRWCNYQSLKTKTIFHQMLIHYVSYIHILST